jgi:hypothetical protein
MSGAFTSVADYRPSSKVCTAFAASEHRPEQPLNKTEHTYAGEILSELTSRLLELRVERSEDAC